MGDIQWWSYWWDGKEGLKNRCMHVILHTTRDGWFGVCGVSCMSTDVSEYSLPSLVDSMDKSYVFFLIY